MIFDFQSNTVIGGLITYPDVVFSAKPLAGAVVETVAVAGSSSTTINVTGSFDSQE